MLKKIESRDALKEITMDVKRRTMVMLETKENLCIEWETKCDEAMVEVKTYEDLIMFYDTPDMNKKLANAYNKLRHYQHIYHKVVTECEELEEALKGLEKAAYWL